MPLPLSCHSPSTSANPPLLHLPPSGATEAFDMVYSGGKKDDITVLVAQVTGDSK